MANPFDTFDKAAPSGNPFDQFGGGAATPKSADYEAGRAMGSGVQGFFSAMQGPTLGFADEIAGAGGAIAGGIANLFGKDDGTTYAERYRRVRDAVRGASDEFMADRPILGTATRLATGAPLIAVGGPGAPALGVARAAPVGLGASSLQAGRTAAAFGGAQGLGDSTAEDVGGMLADAGKGAATSFALGAGGNVAVSGVGGAVDLVRRGVSRNAAQEFARLKAAEAFARDAKRNPIAIEDAQDALRTFGAEGRVADAGGESVKSLLDTMATLPGRTKTLTEEAIRARQAGRGARIVDAADDALGTGGRSFVAELDDLAAAKARESAPLYDQVRNVPVQLDDEVKALLARVPREAWRDAARIHKTTTGQALKVDDILAADSIPLSMLDTLKRGLYADAQALKRAGKGEVAYPVDDLRTALIAKLDDLSPKDAAGQSIYKSARETFGGFAQLEDLVQAGRKAFSDDAIDIAAMTRGLDEAQAHAFRIGALQALKQKAGTEGGQTSLLKFWKEPATQDRLRAIFGDDPAAVAKFAAALEREGKLKGLESVGRGSQTASRQAAIGDLDLSPVAAPVGVKERAANAFAALYGRLRTPEATRDEIGRILLAQGDAGAQELNALRAYLNRVNDARVKRASTLGTFAGIAP